MVFDRKFFEKYVWRGYSNDQFRLRFELVNKQMGHAVSMIAFSVVILSVLFSMAELQRSVVNDFLGEKPLISLNVSEAQKTIVLQQVYGNMSSFVGGGIWFVIAMDVLLLLLYYVKNKEANCIIDVINTGKA